jgi:hypothetical protein
MKLDQLQQGLEQAFILNSTELSFGTMLNSHLLKK